MINSILETFKKKWWFLVPLIVFVIHLIVIFFILPSELIKDERFFYPMAERFLTINSENYFSLLQNYPLPQPPTLFLISSLFLKIFHSIYTLRFFNALLFFLLQIFLFRTYQTLKGHNFRNIISFLACWLFNPYVHLIAVCFYTDTFYLFSVSLIFLFTLNQNQYTPLKFVAYFLAPMIRQFGIIYAGGKILETFLSTPITEINLKKMKSYCFYSASFLGLLAFFILWKSTFPSAEIAQKMSQLRQQAGPLFFTNLTYSLAAWTFWTLPLWIMHFKKSILDKYTVIFFPMALIYSCFFYPTKSIYHQELQTLGYFHKMLNLLPGTISIAIYALFLAFGLNLYKKIIQQDSTFKIYKIWISLFFALQLINPLAWDKYLLELILITFFAL